MIRWLLCVSVLSYIAVVYSCVGRNYGHGSIVCVCNKTQCDTIAPVERTPRGTYTLYTSSKSGDRFKKTRGEFEKRNSQTYKNDTLYINRKRTYQSIFGFGGAFTDSAGYNILSLSNATRTNLMRSYYSDYGLQYSIGRIPMAGTDFSSHFYTYDDVRDDYDLNYFSLQHEDYFIKIPLIHWAQNLTNYDIIFFGSPWTAPTWMKTNNDFTGIGFLNVSMYVPWANYFLKFIDAYERNNVSIWGITTGNEPANGYGFFIDINDMGWIPELHAQWIAENLGPTIRLSDYPDVKIMIIDDQRLYLPWVAKTVMQSHEASNYIDGTAVHYYLDQVIPADVLSLTHFDFPDKFILATEACAGSGAKHPVILGSWERAETYLHSVIDDMNNWVTGWMDWNLALNTQGGPTWVGNYVDSPIIVNQTADEFYKQPTFYAMGHFAKFIRPNSVKIFQSLSSSPLKVTAFKRPDDGIVVQIFNPTNNTQLVTIIDEVLNYEKTLRLEKRSINSMIYW